MPGTAPALVPAQLRRLARTYAISSRTVLDVGPAVDWGLKSSRREHIVDARDIGGPQPGVTTVALAASVPVKPHQCQVVLVRTSSLLHNAAPGNPEAVIALANLLSCVRPGGTLAIVMEGSSQLGHWKQLLAGFPGTMHSRVLTGGLWAMSWIAWLTRPAPAVHVVEFRLNRKPISRLAWHQLARDRIMGARRADAA
jgi:hypothetical protein